MGQPPYDDRTAFPLPGLLLLDLRMPRMDGFAVLNWIRQRSEFANLTVAVMTSAADIRDVNTAFALGANSFMIKPVDFMRFAEFTQALSGSWEWLSQSPEQAAQAATAYACEGVVA
jgi:CheY-like chemotaxis protein